MENISQPELVILRKICFEREVFMKELIGLAFNKTAYNADSDVDFLQAILNKIGSGDEAIVSRISDELMDEFNFFQIALETNIFENMPLDRSLEHWSEKIVSDGRRLSDPEKEKLASALAKTIGGINWYVC